MAEKRKFKIGINNIVSWGATVVIIGLMAKLQHWPAGDWLIVLGLGTEALLFLILGFQNEEKDVDWTKVYPELADDYKGDVKTSYQKSSLTAATGTTAALDKMLENAKISPELIGNLGDGLRTFSDKVSTISNIADASVVTNQFTDKVKGATSSFEKLNLAFEKASSDLAGIGGSSTDTKTYQEQISKLASNLQQLNAVYELELKESGENLKNVSQHYASVAQTLKNFNDSASDTQQLKDQVGQLNKNLASLNAIYGNMLAAMNQPGDN